MVGAIPLPRRKFAVTFALHFSGKKNDRSRHFPLFHFCDWPFQNTGNAGVGLHTSKKILRFGEDARRHHHWRCGFVGIAMILWIASSNLAAGAEAKILDLEHHSKVLGEARHYRIFLPPNYDSDNGKRFPVIYFFHGWGERYNLGPREGAGAYDRGADYHGDNIAAFVEKNSVIVVKWDGYNPRTPNENYPRPYNIGPVETYRQFPLYFPELVDYIDTHYRTIADREHRGISGLSMGGFMAFWIGGKYPHLVGSVSNFMGSPEFVTGPREFPSEYLHTDMYRNYEGVRTRLVLGTKDFIRWYHGRMNQVWDFTRSNYEHETFEWDHGTPGMAKQLQFHLNAFAHPLPKPTLWHHIDVYPVFDAWGYSISTDRHRAGFTVLENVTNSGFRSSVRTWLWEGQTLPSVRVSVTTDAIYKANGWYRLVDVNLRTKAIRNERQQADGHGRLHIQLDGELHEVGIVESENPVLTLARFTIDRPNWPTVNMPVQMNLHILNKGTAPARNIRLNLKSANPAVKILMAQSEITNLGEGEILSSSSSFRFVAENPEQAMARFDLELGDQTGQIWIVPFEVPIFPQVPDLENAQIADGRRFRIQAGGNQVEEKLLGIGNGDGVANPGESLVALIKDQGEFRPAFLFSNDPFVNPSGLNLRFSDNWGNYDHVGGSAKYSMPTISAHCPAGHEITFMVEYLTPHAPEHIIKRGLLRVKVEGVDSTAPKALSAELSAGNILEVQLVEGGAVKTVTARIIQTLDPSVEFVLELNDDGIKGDLIGQDTWFSAIAPDLPPGEYHVTLGMTDSAGNTGTDSFDLIRK
jgi:S-formylglutathione hydrolase FrmB